MQTDELQDPSINKLLEYGENAIEKGKRFGADDIEIYIQFSRKNRVDVDTGYVDTFGGRDYGVGVRAVIGQKVGFSSTTFRNTKEIVDTVRRATKIAKLKEEDPHFNHLPDPKQGGTKAGIFDADIVALELGELTEMAKKSADMGEAIGDYVANINVTATSNVLKKAIISTRGIRQGDKRTYLSAYSRVKGEKDDELTTGMEIVYGREMKREQLLDVGEQAADRAGEMFNAQELEEPMTGKLVVENMSLFSFLWPLIYNVNGNNVADGRSRFEDKLGEKVASDFTILDDGTLPEGLRTAKVDDEGIPMTKKKIIENGQLKNHLFDSYAALRMGEENTGNAIRSGYSELPDLSYTNLRIPNGAGDMGDFVEEVDNGVLVTGMMMGSHLTDPVKGNFGLTCKNAFVIENGALLHPLKEVTVSGNFFELLKNILKVGADEKLTRAGKLPSIMAKNVDFA